MLDFISIAWYIRLSVHQPWGWRLRVRFGLESNNKASFILLNTCSILSYWFPQVSSCLSSTPQHSHFIASYSSQNTEHLSFWSLYITIALLRFDWENISVNYLHAEKTNHISSCIHWNLPLHLVLFYLISNTVKAAARISSLTPACFLFSS